jgi:hypothetical protein
MREKAKVEKQLKKMELFPIHNIRLVDKMVPLLCTLLAISIGGFLKIDVKADGGG